MSHANALARRRESDMALMPPPPVRRIKRPAIVLDEDDYTDALADIIARDYFPGLGEARAQEEYLTASESNNESWIEQAGKSLLHATKPPFSSGGIDRTTRGDSSGSPSLWATRTPLSDTPRTSSGQETPAPVIGSGQIPLETGPSKTGMTSSSLSQFQANYTSEDNECFNAVLDKQNLKRREKHAYLWTSDQHIPSKQLITQRANNARLEKKNQDSEALALKDGKELIPITTGAVASRPAKPDSWRQKTPVNSLMFLPDSIGDSGLQTLEQTRQATSKAGPKEIVFANTRFPPQHMIDDPGSVPASPSLNTTIIAHRDARRANNSDNETPTFAGSETPRVNGYSFVDDEERSPSPPSVPSYRDLLAGQVGDSTPNPFMIHRKSTREDLHHRLVEKDNRKNRRKQNEATPSINIRTGAQNGMTPAAKKLMERLGQTPVPGANSKNGRMSSKEMWTPVATPRRTKP